MAVGRYWQLNLIGRYSSGTWLGEMAQVGIRGTIEESGGFFPPVILAPYGSFAADPTGDSETTTDFQITYGALGPDAWSKPAQKQAAAAMKAFGTAIKTFVPAAFRWEEIRLSAFTSANSVINGATVFQYVTPEVGSGATMSGTPNKAVVASLVTGGRGPKARGRMYLPAPQVALSTDGTVSSSTRTTVNTAVRNLVVELAAIDNWYPGVVSTTHNVWSSITAVRTGDEFDNQSRRRAQRKEQYTVLPI